MINAFLPFDKCLVFAKKYNDCCFNVFDLLAESFCNPKSTRENMLVFGGNTSSKFARIKQELLS